MGTTQVFGPSVRDAAGWPFEIAPEVSAALDNPQTGSLIFQQNLQLLHATSRLGPLLGIKRENLTRGSDIIHLLRTTATLDHDSLVLLEMSVESSLGNPEAVNDSIILSSVDGSRSIALGTRRIGPECWMSTFEDVTNKREVESRLLKLALLDPLTGLGNRSSFERSVTSGLARSAEHSVAVLLVDLDRFKAVNDTLGHPTGDGVLRLVAQRILSVVGECGATARLGGDEFAILISPGVCPTELAGLAGRIIDLLQRTFLVGGNAVNVGASVGIAASPSDGNSTEGLLKSADLALYHSKASGRGTFNFFDQAMEERAQLRRNLELELRKALPLRQLEVHYTPQVDTATNTLLGFEAALRWRHPQRGLMEPEDFTSLAEELGLTVQIGDWMLRTGCREAAKWPEQLRISMSASSSQFESGRYVESVVRALEAGAISGTRLEIKVTESVLFRKESEVFATLHELRKLGVKVAMGDFGAGYASLNQLASFPFDRVNIDRPLLVAGADNAKQRAIVRAIAALGASLGISTVGEGIETSVELARIHSDGCSSVQGYLPGKRIPAKEVQQLIGSFSQHPDVADAFEEGE